MEVLNLRQAEPWLDYLRFVGWDIEETSSGINIALRGTPLGNVAKVQRPNNLTHKDLDEIEQICKERKSIYIKIEPRTQEHGKLLKARDYQRSKFPLSPPSIIYIDLTKNEQELWKQLSRSCKYSVRRARREGNTVETIQNPNEKELKEFYVLTKDTGKKKKFYVQPYEDLLKQKEIFGESSYLAKVYGEDGILQGAKFYLAHKNTVIYLLGGTTDEGRKGKGGYVLMWQSILYFKDKGYEFLNLEGVDDDRFPLYTKGWGGFSHFKEKFGGEVVRLPPPYIKYESRALKVLSQIQELPL